MSIGTRQELALEVAADLVLWAEKVVTSIRAADITCFSHLAMVSEEAPLCGFCSCMNNWSPLRREPVSDMYSFKCDTTHVTAIVILKLN